MSLFQSASPGCSVAPKNQLVILLVRGVAGIGLLWFAFRVLPHSPIAGWTLLAAAVLLLKGCPACWGMHLVNALRRSGNPSLVPPTVENERPLPRSQQYAPKDRAEHLFPPEDVHRFRQRSDL